MAAIGSVLDAAPAPRARPPADPIEDRVAALSAALNGPSRLNSHLIAEARDGRADVARRRREDRVEEEPAPGPASAVDDTLQLYFLCAHPSLTPASAVALTLRAVGGLTTRQIAAAYLVPEATMAQRISRAKRTVSSVRFDRPGDVATV
ncbi:sigma factor-like helix-turn-helix DNA-binding protein, partial [Streptomyces sp. 8K308]|uniref:sigma factor-like helix-turn-helix DNA-binding protein n=1 Tax=Streptomyces sp. 8K308 TaxID=2530388 RepID=UPI003264C93C